MKKLSGLMSRVAMFGALCLSACAQEPVVEERILDKIAGLVVPEIASAGARRPFVACVPCGYVQGKNDVKKLCAASVAPWKAMVSCACQGNCSSVCSADWCARLDDPWYKDASPACNACMVLKQEDGGALPSCWPEILACSGAM